MAGQNSTETHKRDASKLQKEIEDFYLKALMAWTSRQHMGAAIFSRDATFSAVPPGPLQNCDGPSHCRALEVRLGLLGDGWGYSSDNLRHLTKHIATGVVRQAFGEGGERYRLTTCQGKASQLGSASEGSSES